MVRESLNLDFEDSVSSGYYSVTYKPDEFGTNRGETLFDICSDYANFSQDLTDGADTDDGRVLLKPQFILDEFQKYLKKPFSYKSPLTMVEEGEGMWVFGLPKHKTCPVEGANDDWKIAHSVRYILEDLNNDEGKESMAQLTGLPLGVIVSAFENFFPPDNETLSFDKWKAKQVDELSKELGVHRAYKPHEWYFKNYGIYVNNQRNV